MSSIPATETLTGFLSQLPGLVLKQFDLLMGHWRGSSLPALLGSFRDYFAGLSRTVICSAGLYLGKRTLLTRIFLCHTKPLSSLPNFALVITCLVLCCVCRRDLLLI